MSNSVYVIAEAGRSRLVKANLDARTTHKQFVCPGCAFDEEHSRFTTTSDPRQCGKCAIDGRRGLFSDPENKRILIETWRMETAYHNTDHEED